ncbi:HIRAN domain-containing protein [Sulfitobacter aestuariivivens]|uniref:HIRAN domain-containing protein n=1 Tax=Sulfitobacter aestuariivivens TaxID=2766981 RepID=UPI003CCCA5B3
MVAKQFYRQIHGLRPLGRQRRYIRFGYELEGSAKIEREPNNAYYLNAVAATIQSRTVGYLSREQAQRLSAQMIEDGIESARCSAKIVGG